ncbi:hypothetical protein, partial [Rhodococcus sp. BS-15]|uniref:hypothetical protein n=1 Tax=Rhodococcus sp. BS-15 TaxID=1304954 RepID=UPI00165115E6
LDRPAAAADSVSAIFASNDSATVTADRADILLVEDNVDLRNYLVRLLIAEGWSVTAAGDIDSALERARSAKRGSYCPTCCFQAAADWNWSTTYGVTTC